MTTFLVASEEFFVGVDPGKRGAAAAIDRHGCIRNVVRFDNMAPEEIVPKMFDLCEWQHATVAIERVTAGACFAKNAAFTFGEWFCACRIAAQEAIRRRSCNNDCVSAVHLVPADVWTRFLLPPRKGAAIKGDKTRQLRRIRQLYLASELRQARILDHDGAIDAVLIANYARTAIGGLPLYEKAKDKSVK